MNTIKISLFCNTINSLHNKKKRMDNYFNLEPLLSLKEEKKNIILDSRKSKGEL